MPLTRPFLAAVVVTVAVSVLGVVGWHAASGHVAAASAERIASASPTASPTPTLAPFTIDSDVVVIGDSIMAGYGLDDAADAWPAVLGQQTGAQVANDSCSGAGFVSVGDCGTDFAGLVPRAVTAKPELVVVQSSDNDFDSDPTTVAQATQQTVAQIHQAMPGATIVGLSTLWDQPGDVPAEVAQTSSALQQAVTSVGGTFIDVGQPLAGHADWLQADSEHPTVAGQQVLAATFRADLERAGFHL
ncbi:SGNH/GDSL hydrolase family protein [Curtobacterium sp. MCBA15_012]|uniref:SGNH/GDSL hydrolase family protein n=1 Tax=Curtobacterium sp. MCBA15_012 TaxID=1898738 RepID=UPI0008DDD50A|nr:SGNH/GDSL hydrolase family protein [Curtobacterium sp. MCBA15_012]WIB01224.1 SGNH/GDSL hydrolase family protein [Curtobacterium sp. MCBA15_012]